MKKLELVFMPLAGTSHQMSAMQFAKRLLDQDERLSVTIFVIVRTDYEPDRDPYTKLALASSNDRIKFKTIISQTQTDDLISDNLSLEMFANLFFESNKSQVEGAILEMLSDDDSVQLVGFVLDMFSSCMIDVANKFKVPSYMYLPLSTAFLGFILHLPTRDQDQFHPSDPDSIIPCYENPVPVNVLPKAVFDKSGGGYDAFLYHGAKFLEAKGFIVNSFVELEPYAVDSVVNSTDIPVYQVGPLVDRHTNRNNSAEIMNWLDEQPQKSVIFLCFGGAGSFSEPQLEQMAIALEMSNQRFLWSIRKPPIQEIQVATSDYTNLETVLPKGFLERVKERGMVCGWAPQVEVLGHGAIKRFISHCGWNSVLVSLWFGVPLATWPLDAEQQLNAFLLVKELGLAVELSLSYRSFGSELVMADRIGRAIRSLVDDDNPVRGRVKEISEKGNKAVMNGGSSFVALRKLVQDMLQNIGEK